MKGDEGYIVDMRLLVLQPINAQWIIHFFDYVKAHNAIITKDYAMLVYLEVWNYRQYHKVITCKRLYITYCKLCCNKCTVHV